MAKWKSKDTFVSINGVDISKFVESAHTICSPFDPVGLQSLGPITISGVWYDGRETCAVCGERFTPGPEGTARITANDTGEDFGVACPACGVAIMAGDGQAEQ